ncbi:hypothetical protein [Pseudooceanicola nanhaiensis]|uniref:hypothetical protein n=1 Tax=Pseudooceanicola nanhaiensis TaxID=375761 RepID=UPI001CD1E3E9|nr:hypothetical protein [Pseudooceanicola nanhaiensis]MCA0921530.1 hypothetical protein [Pseudooceanicola nanhaiensis]
MTTETTTDTTHDRTISFTTAPPRERRVTFRVYSSLRDLPQAPGLYVLLARLPGRADEARPLYFGLAPNGLDRDVPRSEIFHTAMRNGLTQFAAVAMPGLALSDHDAMLDLARTLGRDNHASLNAAREALRNIDAVQRARSTARAARSDGDDGPIAAE